MDVIDRRKSVSRAFEVVGPRRVEGCSILVIDDVYTTGSTVSSVAETLLEAGASSVRVFTIARVPRIKTDLRPRKRFAFSHTT
jgi:predicted amidophosphoribosyltransferase